MLFRQLEYFVALARERHFSRAAAACYVSQPALSEAIGKLERGLGVPLVRRTQNFQGLTPEGEQLADWARRILADRDGMEQAASALAGALTGRLRLGAVPGAATTVTALIDGLAHAHPQVRVGLDAGLQSAQIADRIRRFELDAGLVYPDGIDVSGLAVTTLYYENHVLVAEAALLRPLTPDRTGAPAWAAVAELPLCLLRTGMRGRDLVDEAAAAHQVVLEPRVETDAVSTLLALAGTGRWACIVPRTWLTDPAPPGQVSLPLPAAPGERAGAALGARVALVRAAAEPVSVLTAALERHARDVTWAP
ncbi:LysR family transcriptional regulator [Gordonia hirsuta]|nr:LysR family transcriptional regulator [Gordonia hirsuta]